jgi:serine/threonine protein kinase
MNRSITTTNFEQKNYIFSTNGQDKIQKFNIGKKIGKGVYGTVFDLGKDYAGKIYNAAIDSSTIREISILSYLNHPNIVKIIGNGIVDGKLMLIMEKAKGDISLVMNSINSAHRSIILFQILNAVSFLHKYNIAHRDIKPQNILLFNNIDIKLCDFGLSKIGVLSNITHSPDVVTLWYRAPEVILNPGNYDMSIDVWSIGIILLEMLLKDKFPINDNNEISTLFKIFRLIGTPNEKTWNGLSKMKNWKDTFPKFEGNIDKLLFNSDASDHEKDLLKKMLTYPLNRISAFDALNHPYFNEIKKKYPRLNTYMNIANINNTLSTILHPLEHKEIFCERVVILFNWLIEVKNDFKLNHATMFTTFNIFNEYIKYNNIKKKYIQLVGIACLDIACKLLEVVSPDVDDWLSACANCYTENSIEKMISNLLLYFNFNIVPMIIYDNNDVFYKNEIFLKIICCCMTNNTIVQNWTFENIVNISKMIINRETCPEITFIFSYVKSMLQCDLKTTLLSYIGEVDYKQEVKNIEISHTDDIIKHNEAVIEQNEVVMTISQDTILFDTLNVSDVVQV